jgi:hypothetical protein
MRVTEILNIAYHWVNKCKVNELQEREPFPVGYNYRPVQLR